jgi:hypothetical protein
MLGWRKVRARLELYRTARREANLLDQVTDVSPWELKKILKRLSWVTFVVFIVVVGLALQVQTRNGRLDQLDRNVHQQGVNIEKQATLASDARDAAKAAAAAVEQARKDLASDATPPGADIATGLKTIERLEHKLDVLNEKIDRLEAAK